MPRATQFCCIVAGLDEGLAAAEAETGVSCLLIADIDRAFGPNAGFELVERRAELRRSAAGVVDVICCRTADLES